MTQTADPFAGQQTTTGAADDSYDPFGTDNPEDAGGNGGGGNKYSFPSISGLAADGGHLVILEPYDYDANALDPNDAEDAKRERRPQKTREQFLCYLHVLSGPVHEVKERIQDDQGNWVESGKYLALGSDAHPWPIAWRRVTIAQKVLIGQLKDKFDTSAMTPRGSGRWLGRLRFVPGSRTPKHLKNLTPDALDKARADEIRRSGGAQGLGLAVKIMNPTPEEVAQARAYWAEAAFASN